MCLVAMPIICFSNCPYYVIILMMGQDSKRERKKWKTSKKDKHSWQIARK